MASPEARSRQQQVNGVTHYQEGPPVPSPKNKHPKVQLQFIKVTWSGPGAAL